LSKNLINFDGICQLKNAWMKFDGGQKKKIGNLIPVRVGE